MLIQVPFPPLAALAFLLAQASLLQTGHTEYEFPGSGWRVWESREESAETPVYSMFIKARIEPSLPPTSLHVTCTGNRFDVFARTSATVLSEHSERYQQNLVAVRLRHHDESVTKSYLFSPLEDNHGFYLYKSLVTGDSARQGVERLLGHPGTRMEFEEEGGTTVTALFDLREMKGLYSSLRQACRSGHSMGSIEPRLVAQGSQSSPIGAETDKDAPDRQDPPLPASSPPTSTSVDTPSAGAVSIFGLSMGLGLEEVARRIEGLPVAVQEQPELYVLPRVPTPNPDFEVYLGLIRPDTGLCEVRAVGQATNSDPGGTAIRHAFHNNVAMLHKLFGPYDLVDTSRPGSEVEPGHWMSGLHTGETLLLAEWSRANDSRLEDNLEKILLTVRAENEVTARLVLQVTFSNFTAAQRP